jgi:mRNA interferase MazF
MEEFVKGDVVVIPFPFSDLSSIKLRPALIIVELPNRDVILCHITSKQKTDGFSISLEKNDFTSGGLDQLSFIRPNRIFTAEKSIIRYRAGTIPAEKQKEVRNKIVSLLDQSL